MIQFNLLPDVKLDYIKAQRSRRFVLSTSIIVSLAAVALLVLLLTVDGLQKKHLSDLNHDIASETTTLQKKPNLNKILTVQNQLESLTALHNAKPAASQLFNYLNVVTPATVSITTLNVDFTQDAINITGTADTISSINKYVDTLKLTTYSSETITAPTSAFNNVVLSSFGASTTKSSNQAASYSIAMGYDKNIFDNTQTIKLTVPTITTRAQLQNPTDLFIAPAGSK